MTRGLRRPMLEHSANLSRESLTDEKVGDRVVLTFMGKQLVVGTASVLLQAIVAPFRATGVQRGGCLIDFIPPRLLGGRVISVDTDAGPLVIRISDTGARQFLMFGRPLSDIEETKIVCAFLPSVRGMLDIGASYGWYTKFATNLMGPQAPKVALEANPEVATCLERSLCGLPGVRVLNVAATDRPRKVSFYCARGSGLSSTVRDVGTQTVVEGLPVDDIWTADQPLDFVKCDVEGGELEVLRGARRIRKAHEPIWMLEFDERFLTEAAIEPTKVADEVSDLLCWWRSNKNGWVLAKNLEAILGEERTCQNVFLVPRGRAAQFARLIDLIK
jgi:FkbM family methyltransferase